MIVNRLYTNLNFSKNLEEQTDINNRIKQLLSKKRLNKNKI